MTEFVVVWTVELRLNIAKNKAKLETAPSANCTQKLIGLTTPKVAANFCLVGTGRYEFKSFDIFVLLKPDKVFFDFSK
jgi:hypothetical protein